MKTPVYMLLAASLLLQAGLAAAQSADIEDPSDDGRPPGSIRFEWEPYGSVTNLGEVSLPDGPYSKLADRWPEDLVVAPVPGYSPQVGWSLALGAGYFLDDDHDDDVPPSVLGGFVWGAENGSYAYGLGVNLHLLDDRLRIKAGAAYADISYRFYGIGSAENDRNIGLKVDQKAPMFFATGSWRVWKKLYLGLGYLASDVESQLRIELDPPPRFDPTLKSELGAVSIPIQWDSRDHEQFPRNGWLISGRSMLYRESLGSDFDAETMSLSANHYLPIGETDVIALRAYARSTSGDAPFFLLSTFGGSTDLRGYPSGRYRDRAMYALQGEYRWQLSDKWIVTGFAGFGEVAEDFSDFGDNYLPAAGIGARFVISQKHRVSLSVDIAYGKDGGEFYLGVGEAF